MKRNSECREVDGRQVILAGRRQLPTGKSYFLGNTAHAFWRIAVLAAAGIVGAASPGEAAPSGFWPDYYEPPMPFVYARPRLAPPRVRKSTHKYPAPKKEEVAKKDIRKPQGPLIIAISIEKQVLKIYDANGYFAETPISTGMAGHPTPMGVFSVIQKDKHHRSNIYSGAPMPYMQRITWSGVAMHAGVLPGYPASHGCIRMPMNFAMQMWDWTRMGARVVVAPGELVPEHFSHPLLATQKTAPVAVTEPPKAVNVAVTAKSDKGAIAPTSAFSETSLELKSTLGHDLTKPPASTQTADASDALRELRSPLTVVDAPVATTTTAADVADASSEPRSPPAVVDAPVAASTNTADAGDAPSEPRSPPAVVAANPTIKPDAPVETESAAAETKPAETDTSGQLETRASDTAKAETGTPEAARIDPAEVADIKADASKPDVKAAAEADTAAADVKKDQARPSDPEKAAIPKPQPAVAAAPKSRGQIAVFVSKKDGKLYVRENFVPLFDVPVTIAPGDRPLGTHLFTAQTDKDDANLLHWSVVSMPVVAPRYGQDSNERASRRRKTIGAIEVKSALPPNTAAEALDRLTIRADAMAMINEALSTGGSIVVSDYGMGGETAKGTEFIIPLR
jgi:lipoprotein-anchoring transpeptidase ErfK/SrfK